MTELKPAEILASYEQLTGVTARMREAAVHEDWDQVIALEGECSGLYARLMGAREVGAIDRNYERRKSELICKLLEDDAEIRERLNGQLTRLWRQLEGKGRVKRVGAAYGASR